MNTWIKILICYGLYGHAMAQSKLKPGKLFIIGGGDRPPELMQKLIAEAGLAPQDHIAILTNSSASPDTSYHYLVQDLRPHSNNSIAMFHFTKKPKSDKSKNDFSVDEVGILDSLRKAKLIFITGGVQGRFMDVVLNTPVHQAIKDAYRNGSMIAGTSAGAAVMSKEMITGDQVRADTLYSGSVDRIIQGNIQIQEGLGLITSVVIDQHFIVRSRYNRLLTVLHQYPSKLAIGIDEETAILVYGDRATVFGTSQVVVLRKPKGLEVKTNKVLRFKKVALSLYTSGDTFMLN